VVESLCCAIKEDPLQIRGKGNDVNVIFWEEGFKVSRSGYGI
jgi:hypothetical protein